MPHDPQQPVAILYQAAKPPVHQGAVKPMKPGGYSDSGADIAYTLRAAGITVITPVPDPNPHSNLDWVFPDTAAGIAEAIARGAEILWANTNLFAGHPLEDVRSPIRIVGQLPAANERIDDKSATNRLLREAGLPVAASIIVAHNEPCDLTFDSINASTLDQHHLALPLMLKPIRGRGSQGIVLVHTLDELLEAARRLTSATETVDGVTYPLYGSRLILERYLPGDEITLTIMPAGDYVLPSGPRTIPGPWSLPAVRRTGHDAGVLPYSGLIAVTQNSTALTPAENLDPAVQAVTEACIAAAELIGQPRAPIRIDCRRGAGDVTAPYCLFDLNMKPNLTGAGRPGRDTQDCLPAIAARAMGWTYADLLRNTLAQSWSQAG